MDSPLPPPAERAIQKLGRDISLARRRRHISQASLAERMGASLTTVRHDPTALCREIDGRYAPNQQTAGDRDAVEPADADAQFHLGWRYANGEGVEKDLHQAVAWVSVQSWHL